MKKQLVIVGITLVLITIGLSGCLNNNGGGINNKFVGKWRNIDAQPGYKGYYYKTITFYSDKRVEFTNWINESASGTYEYNETNLTIHLTGVESATESFSYIFTDNETLVLFVYDFGIHYKKS
jgi:hypothetical protein